MCVQARRASPLAWPPVSCPRACVVTLPPPSFSPSSVPSVDECACVCAQATVSTSTASWSGCPRVTSGRVTCCVPLVSTHTHGVAVVVGVYAHCPCVCPRRQRAVGVGHVMMPFPVRTLNLACCPLFELSLALPHLRCGAPTMVLPFMQPEYSRRHPSPRSVLARTCVVTPTHSARARAPHAASPTARPHPCACVCAAALLVLCRAAVEQFCRRDHQPLQQRESSDTALECYSLTGVSLSHAWMRRRDVPWGRGWQQGSQ